MRQRQMEFYQGWDQEEAIKRKPQIDEEGDSTFHEEFEGNDDGATEAEALQVEAQANENEEEEEQSEPVSLHLVSVRAVYALLSLTNILQEFNMAQMLQSLNIDLSLLGYDEVEEKWID